MGDRWATFDCYGTLIDWNGGIRSTLRRLWPEADIERLLRRHHAIEPLVQEGRSLKYREVGARTVRAVAAVDGLPLDDADAFALADSLPSWPGFPEVPTALRQLKDAGWRLAILSNTDPELLSASMLQIGVPVDLRITAAEAGSRPLAAVLFRDRRRQDPPCPRRGELVSRHRSVRGTRPHSRVDQQALRTERPAARG